MNNNQTIDQVLGRRGLWIKYVAFNIAENLEQAPDDDTAEFAYEMAWTIYRARRQERADDRRAARDLEASALPRENP